MITQKWLLVTEECTAGELVRVESGANVADGPSRGDVSMWKKLGAVEITLQWPDSVRDPWSAPLVSEFSEECMC